MLDPTAILIAVLVALGLVSSGFIAGKEWTDRAYAAQERDVQKSAIAGANAATETAIKLAVEQAKTDTARRVAYQRIRLEGERDAALKARPECSRDVDSQRLLLNAIGAANGVTPTTGSMPDAVRPAAITGVGK